MLNNQTKWKLEILWWLVTLVITIGVIYPIVSKVESYPYLLENIIFVVVFITVTRHVFFLRHSFLARAFVPKIVLIILCIPVIAYLFHHINGFQYFLDEMKTTDWNQYLGNSPFAQQVSLKKYMRAEMLFFGVAAVIACLTFMGRMVLSLWRLKNKGTC